ncbi:hypothetical protein D3C71_1761800 [compost metagenome]
MPSARGTAIECSARNARGAWPSITTKVLACAPAVATFDLIVPMAPGAACLPVAGGGVSGCAARNRFAMEFTILKDMGRCAVEWGQPQSPYRQPSSTQARLADLPIDNQKPAQRMLVRVS